MGVVTHLQEWPRPPKEHGERGGRGGGGGIISLIKGRKECCCVFKVGVTEIMLTGWQGGGGEAEFDL